MKAYIGMAIALACGLDALFMAFFNSDHGGEKFVIWDAFLGGMLVGIAVMGSVSIAISRWEKSVLTQPTESAK